MDRVHEVERVSFSGTRMRLSVDGTEHEVDVARFSRRLAEASPAERESFVVSPTGYGIRWPDLDEDLSIDGLIGVEHECPLAKASKR
jgi:hypothetical protein